MTETEAWTVIVANTQDLIDKIKERRVCGEAGLPDTSDLQDDLNRIYQSNQ